MRRISFLTALIMSSYQQERQRNDTCICNWPDCAKYHRAAFMKGDEGDDPWCGMLKPPVRISQPVKSKAFRYAITHHLGAVIDSEAAKICIAPHHFARVRSSNQFSHLQTIVTKQEVKLVDLAEYGRDSDCPHEKDVNLVTSFK
jgi:hypothetical protein